MNKGIIQQIIGPVIDIKFDEEQMPNLLNADVYKRQGMSRQPEVAGKIQTGMIVGMAIMETIGVLTFVIAIMLSGKV